MTHAGTKNNNKEYQVEGLEELQELEDNEWTHARYSFFAVVPVKREPDPPFEWQGRVVHSYYAPQLIVSDVKTGELFRVAGWYFMERHLQRETILQKLRSQPQHFARFLLRFRNHRRGLTPELSKLTRLYAHLYGLRSDNVRRYIAPLKAAGVLESDTLMGLLFQLSKADKRVGEYLAEECEAGSAFAKMWARKETLRQQRAEFVGDADSLLEPLRLSLAQPRSEGFGCGVVVPLQHLEGLVPGDCGQFDDVWQLRGEPGCSGMAEVMEPHVFYPSTAARPFEAFV